MEYSDFQTKLKALKDEAKKKEQDLFIEYAYANNTLKPGDIVTDHIGSIKIEKISVHVSYLSEPKPMCIYIGIELKKDLTPTKVRKERTVYQSNIVTSTN